MLYIKKIKTNKKDQNTWNSSSLTEKCTIGCVTSPAFIKQNVIGRTLWNGNKLLLRYLGNWEGKNVSGQMRIHDYNGPNSFTYNLPKFSS